MRVFRIIIFLKKRKKWTKIEQRENETIDIIGEFFFNSKCPKKNR